MQDYTLLKEIVSPSQVLGLGCIEGAFLCHAVDCPIDIRHEAYMPLMVFMQYLTQLEGPFWRQIRGQGLAYGYNMYVSVFEHLLYFSLYRATNVVSAFNQFKTITVEFFFTYHCLIQKRLIVCVLFVWVLIGSTAVTKCTMGAKIP